jgi:hypothetical protein
MEEQSMAELMATVRILDLPEAIRLIDQLQHELADWKERALNAERRLQVYSTRVTQSDAGAK